MNTSKAFESYRQHLNSRVKLKGARTERDHRVCQANVFVSKSLNISHHLSLTSDLIELRLLHKLRGSLKISWELRSFSILIELFSQETRACRLLFELSENFYDFIKIN